MPKRLILQVARVPASSTDLPATACREDLGQALRLRLPWQRNRFLLARHLLRHTLTGLVHNAIHPRAWRFSRTSLGKPVIAPDSGLPGFHFNISYAGRVVAMAVSPTEPVGVDIAELRPWEELDIRAALSGPEHVLLTSLQPQERLRQAMRAWTVKEACTKLTGTGFRTDFTCLEVRVSSQAIVCRGLPGFPVSPAICCPVLRLQGREYQLALAVDDRCASRSWLSCSDKKWTERSFFGNKLPVHSLSW